MSNSEFFIQMFGEIYGKLLYKVLRRDFEDWCDFHPGASDDRKKQAIVSMVMHLDDD